MRILILITLLSLLPPPTLAKKPGDGGQHAKSRQTSEMGDGGGGSDLHQFDLGTKTKIHSEACLIPLLPHRTEGGVKLLLADFVNEVMENDCPKEGHHKEALKRVCVMDSPGSGALRKFSASAEIPLANRRARSAYIECLKKAVGKGKGAHDFSGYIPPFTKNCGCKCKPLEEGEDQREACWGNAVDGKMKFEEEMPEIEYFEEIETEVRTLKK